MAPLFREEILPNLPVEKLFPLYSELHGRPTKELTTMLGILLLQQMEDLTDDATIRQFAFNIEWHYALNVTDTADVNAYVSARTLWTMREQVGALGLAQSLFENVTEALAKLFDLDPSRQRIDSVHIFSNMAHLGRTQLFVKTIRKFLVNLKRHHPESYSSLGELALRYEQKNDGQFAVKPSESLRTLQQVGDDCFALVERFKNHDDVLKMDSYKFLVRLFGEQCVVETTGTVSTVVIKASKEVSSASLQNPSDPDAGYFGHKGQGYQLQVMETWSEDKSQPNLITYVDVEAAHQSDANALIPAIEDAAKHALAPTELLADSLYGSDDNLAQAKDLGVEVVAPAMGTVPKGINLADFEFSPDDELLSCPQGQKPQRIKIGKQGGRTVHFNKADCDHCPRQSECPVKRARHSATLRYDAKSLRLARRRAHEKTAVFIEAYRFRAGAEGTMSNLNRITDLKHLRVRGMNQVQLSAVLKATGLNILRATAFRNRSRGPKNGNEGAMPSPKGLFTAVIEQFERLRNVLPVNFDLRLQYICKSAG